MASDDKHSFERFQETVKRLLQVPKEEVDEALKAREERRKHDEQKSAD